MDNEADGAQEYDRLRAELADFVLDALAQKVASGEQPQLAQAIADAIDRRVEQAVAARVGQAQWPDPDTFADQVIAAASARGYGEGEPSRLRSRASSDVAPARPSGGGRLDIRRWSPLQIILIFILGVAMVAAITILILNRTSTPTPVQVLPVPEQTPDGGSNVILPPPVNGAEPIAPARNETRRR